MIYTLLDTHNNTFISKRDNFNSNWMSLIQDRRIVKFAPIGMDDFVPGDSVIVYLDNTKPYGSYSIPNYVKKIFIVGRVNGQNVKFLNDADYIIYTNDIQRRIVEDIVAIHKPHFVMPHHPTPTFFDIKLEKKNRVFIGGRFTQDKINGFYTRLIDLHKSYDKELSFYVMGVDDSTSFKSYVDSLVKWLHESPLNGSRLVNLEFSAQYYKMMQLQIAASKHIHLWRDEPSIDQVNAWLGSGDREILNHYIGESSLLGIAHKFGCIINVAPTISFIPHFTDMIPYEFADFSDDMIRILNSLD